MKKRITNTCVMYFRNVISTDEDIEKTLLSLQSNGFINYYGLQRFGSFAFAPTHEIGRCLIKKDWKKVVRSYFRKLKSIIIMLHIYAF